jgi:outer membrane protein assembly factor BamB
MSSSRSNHPGVRWWPAVIVAMAGMMVLAWVWFSDGGRTGQDRVVMSYPVALVTVLLLTIWLVFFSRMSRRARRTAAALVLGALAFVAVTTRVKGVTGDLVPILEWRWASHVPAPIEQPPSALPPEPAPRATVPHVSQAESASPSSLPAAAPDLANPPVSKVAAGEFSQFLGSSRNGIINGVRLADDWTTRAPRLVWRRPVGAGWSGFAVSHGLAVTQEQRGDREMVIAYSLADGKPKWSHGDDAHYESTIAGEGPRATPTISAGRVFTLGSTGLLNCLDLETGKSIWRRDVGADNQSPQPEWGRSSSPLLVDEFVVVTAGGSAGHSLVAYEQETGAPAWHAGDDVASYSSPIVTTLAGVRQIVVLNQSSVTGHDPATGRVLWNHEWPRQPPSVAIPVILSEDRVLLSAGYGIGSRVLQIARQGEAVTATLVWESPRLKAKFTNPVLHDGFVYGLDDGVLVCLDPATGERRWRSGRYGHGQTLLVGNRLLVTTEDGDVVLVEASPDAHHELARLTAFSQKQWNPPALAGRYLLVRTDTEAACYELP